MAAAAPTQMPAPHVDIDEVDLLEALNAALGIASYYDIYLATSEDDVDCRLCLFNVGSLETVVLWPALLFETVGDLTAQHKDYGPKGSEQKGRLTVFAHRLIRQRELSTSTAAFIFLLGKPDAESLVAVARDKVNEGGGLVFDFKANHQFMYGKAVRTMDTSLIKAFNIAIAKKEGLLARLKRDEENLMKYQQMCVDIFDRMSTNPTEDSCDESSCSVSSRSVSGSSSCHLSMIPIAGDDTSLQNMASSNSYSREATVVSRVLRCVSTSPSSTRRPITSYVMNSQPTDVESTVDHRRFVIPSPNTVSSASCCSPATVASDQHGISVSTDTVRCASPTSPLLASAHANANASECVCQDSGVIDRIGILQMNSEEELERAPIRELLLAAPNEAYRLRLPGRGSIQSRSFQTLCPRELLGAEVMNATLLKVLKPMLPKADDVYIFSSFFMSDLLRTGPNANGRSKPKVTYANVKNWDRSLKREGKILGMRVIFVPIDFQNSHWLFLRVFLPSFTIQLFDSQGVKPENRIYIEAMKEYLTAKMNESSIKVPADDCWTLVDESDRCPRQHNEYDSGLFVLVNITLLAQGIRLTKDSYTEQCFERHHTRERIAFLLWSNSTNMPFPIKNDPRRPMQTRQQTMRRLVFESSSMQMQPASTSTINTSATKALPATPATVGEGERKSVLSRKAVSRKVAWQSVFLSPMSDEFVCSVCENLVVSATQLGCCHAICCASCLHVGTHCPCCRNISSRSGAMHREDIDASLGDAIVLCPNNCGWTGVLNSLPNHHSICRADFYVTATSVQDYRMEDARVTYAMNQVQRLDLGEDITFRRKQSTRQNKDQGRRMHVRAATQARPHYVSVTNDATSRTSQLALAAALLVKLVRPYENVVNSISGKTFGGKSLFVLIVSTLISITHNPIRSRRSPSNLYENGMDLHHGLDNVDSCGHIRRFGMLSLPRFGVRLEPCFLLWHFR